MRGDGRGIPMGLELLDQVAGGLDVDAKASDELDRPGVDARDVGDRAARRVFHRDLVERPRAATTGPDSSCARPA